MEYRWKDQTFFKYALFFHLITHTTASTTPTEILTRENSAVNFYLPRLHDCGSYYLTDPNKSLVLTVSEENEPKISGIYSSRCTVTTLQNGTILLTMHRITWQDEGTFATRNRMPGCQRYYTITLKKPDNEIAFWEKWNGWSQCSATCGSGERKRERHCNIPGRCHGQDTQVETCDANFDCPLWGSWDSWTSCSVTCGIGEYSRSRQCQSGNRIYKDESCVGEPSQVSTCTMKACALWGSWSGWTSCSVTCGTGEYSRRRLCQSNNRIDNDEPCVGESSQVSTCTMKACEHWPADWGPWLEWSTCSVTCGTGQKYRRRLCLINTEHVRDERCSGVSEETTSCATRPCRETSYYWSTWSDWSTCSCSCGVGNQARMRSCLLWASQQKIQEDYCTGSASDVKQCQEKHCLPVDKPKTEESFQVDSSADNQVESSTDNQVDSSEDSTAINGKTETPVPYTVIMGGSVAGFIIILLLVIIVLLIRLKHKKDTAVRRRTIYDPRQSKQIDTCTRSSGSKSNAGRSETESRIYAEIDDDFIDSEFDATSCNDYGPLPSSASPRGTVPGQTAGGGNIFVFDASAIKCQDKLSVPKSANAIRPRKLDNEGYEQPVSSVERQRRVAYENAVYSNIIK